MTESWFAEHLNRLLQQNRTKSGHLSALAHIANSGI